MAAAGVPVPEAGVDAEHPASVVDPTSYAARRFVRRPDADELAYLWDFGDGTGPTPFGTSASITRTFTSAGIYTVTVKSFGSNPTTTTFTLTVTRSSS